MIGNENDMSFSKEIIGNVSTVVLLRHRFITKDMQKKTLEKNQSHGLFLFVKLAMTNNIEKIKAERTIFRNMSGTQRQAIISFA